MSESRESDNSQWLTSEQVSERLGISMEMLTAWRNGGSGPPWLQIGREPRYDEADLRHWVEKTSGWPLSL